MNRQLKNLVLIPLASITFATSLILIESGRLSTFPSVGYLLLFSELIYSWNNSLRAFNDEFRTFYAKQKRLVLYCICIFLSWIFACLSPSYGTSIFAILVAFSLAFRFASFEGMEIAEASVTVKSENVVSKANIRSSNKAEFAYVLSMISSISQYDEARQKIKRRVPTSGYLLTEECSIILSNLKEALENTDHIKTTTLLDTIINKL